MAEESLKIADWQPNLRVAIIGAGLRTQCIKGCTTARPPYRDGDCTKVEVLDEFGRHRSAALSRVAKL